MSEVEFWSALEELRGDFGLTLAGHIRDKQGRCPVCAVARKITGDPECDYRAAWFWGRRIGLPENFICKIVPAADNSQFHSPEIRRKILTAVGLEATCHV